MLQELSVKGELPLMETKRYFCPDWKVRSTDVALFVLVVGVPDVVALIHGLRANPLPV